MSLGKLPQILTRTFFSPKKDTPEIGVQTAKTVLNSKALVHFLNHPKSLALAFSFGNEKPWFQRLGYASDYINTLFKILAEAKGNTHCSSSLGGSPI